VHQFYCQASSQLFLQTPKFDEQLPVSGDGGIPDIHITAFLTAIDNLLTAGRSNAPTRVLTPMKAVVNSVSAIVDDVRAYERRPRSDVDTEMLHALRERADRPPWRGVRAQRGRGGGTCALREAARVGWKG